MKRGSLYIGLGLVGLFVALALLSLVWTPYSVETLEIANKMKPPSGGNWLGTDHFGRDILSMIMVGGQVSISVAFVAVGLGMGLGVPLGLAAAALRGSLLDEIIMRGNDLVFAFPALLIAILIPLAVFGVLGLATVVLIHELAEIMVIANGVRAGRVSKSSELVTDSCTIAH